MSNRVQILTTTLAPSQEFMVWGHTRRAILGNGGGKFSPTYLTQSTYKDKVVMIDVSPGSYIQVAMEVPHWNIVLTRGAELFSLARIKHLDKNGEEVPNSEIIKFLNNPNPLQTLEQYLYEFFIHDGVYNKTFQHKILGLSFDKIPSAMWLLPPGWMKINSTGKVFRQADIKDIITNYELLDDPTPFETDRIIYMCEGVGNNILNPASRIESLKIPLSNLVASGKARNVIITERGQIGMIVPVQQAEGRDIIPLDTEAHALVKKEYQDRNSLDSQGGHVGFPSMEMKWVPMTFDVQQLGLAEGAEQDFCMILGSHGIDRDVFPSTKGATFENKSQGLQSTFQNAFQPKINKLCKQWEKHFIDPKTGESLVGSYTHVPAMQEDQLKEEQAKKTRIEGLSIARRDGIISPDQYALEAKLEFDGDGIVIQNTNPKTNESQKLQ